MSHPQIYSKTLEFIFNIFALAMGEWVILLIFFGMFLYCLAFIVCLGFFLLAVDLPVIFFRFLFFFKYSSRKKKYVKILILPVFSFFYCVVGFFDNKNDRVVVYEFNLIYFIFSAIWFLSFFFIAHEIGDWFLAFSFFNQAQV